MVERTGTIKDEKMSTKSIGYYKDAWNRFERNKAAAVALVLIEYRFHYFWPIQKKYDLPNQDKIIVNYFRLPPQNAILEKLGILMVVKN